MKERIKQSGQITLRPKNIAKFEDATRVFLLCRRLFNRQRSIQIYLSNLKKKQQLVISSGTFAEMLGRHFQPNKITKNVKHYQLLSYKEFVLIISKRCQGLEI
jgi:hypothetical protein